MTYSLDYQLLKKFFFRLDPELAHDFAIHSFEKFPKIISHLTGKISSNSFNNEHNKYFAKSKNLSWRFPVGIAAGLDKDARAIKYFDMLGVGSLEVGTVTPLPQPGNERPRIFRLIKEESLRNSMGFPGDGMSVVASRIKKNISNRSVNSSMSIGVNIGKNKLTIEENTANDYITLINQFKNIADFLVINISSPNTLGLKKLQSIDYLKDFLQTIFSKCHLNNNGQFYYGVPLLLKISPDYKDKETLERIVHLCSEYKLSGIVATNTLEIPSIGKGGVSGKLLYEDAKIVRNTLLSVLSNDDALDLIGVGGFFTPQDMIDYWKHGGKFLQIYTSFIYQGPNLLIQTKKLIDQLYQKSDAKNFDEVLYFIRKDHFV